MMFKHRRYLLVFAGCLIVLACLILNINNRRTSYSDSGRATGEGYAIFLAITQYHKEFHTFPRGSNSDVIDALAGSNPTRHLFLPKAKFRFNNGGECVDPWRKPYQISIKGDLITVSSQHE